MEATALPENYVISGGLQLYHRTVPLDPARHGALAIMPSAAPFGFAAASPTVPVTIDEFDRAMLDYPIVFFGPRRVAVAITGLAPDHNLFVAEDGRYAPGAYIPGYLRRYPFATAAMTEQEAVLCLDEDAACFGSHDTAGSIALFEDGRPSAMLQDTIALVQAYAEAEIRTEVLAALLDELELFEPRQAHFTPPGGTPQLLLDYAMVSRDKLDALPPEQFLRLRATGALPAIYAHLLSAANWDKLPIWAG